MIAPEDQARADLYGVIARLFYAPPDAQLLAQLRQAPAMEGDGALAAGWRELVEASASAELESLEDEHTLLFIGTGKAQVTPYVSHYVLRHSNDNPLVDLRVQLGAWGIGRRESVPEYEDHISGVCETMRFVIAVQQRTPEEQQMFFERFVYRGVAAFCDAVNGCAQARFYKVVARFTRAFMELEKSAFEMAG